GRFRIPCNDTGLRLSGRLAAENDYLVAIPDKRPREHLPDLPGAAWDDDFHEAVKDGTGPRLAEVPSPFRFLKMSKNRLPTRAGLPAARLKISGAHYSRNCTPSALFSRSLSLPCAAFTSSAVSVFSEER